MHLKGDRRRADLQVKSLKREQIPEGRQALESEVLQAPAMHERKPSLAQVWTAEVT